jgi:hypothetical protein
VNACLRQMEKYLGVAVYRLRHPMDLPISRMFGVQRGLRCVDSALDF